MKLFHVGVVRFVAVLGVVLILMFLEPHLSGAVVICSIAGVMMFVGGTRIRWFVLIFTLALCALLYILLLKSILYFERKIIYNDNRFKQK